VFLPSYVNCFPSFDGSCFCFTVLVKIDLYLELIFLLLYLIQLWGTLIMQKRYQGPDYLLSFLVTLGCSVFILYPVIVEPLTLIIFCCFIVILSICVFVITFYQRNADD
jgi:glucan phosphoethanolaminetransferase (alkaline phosphatase superfamily)